MIRSIILIFIIFTILSPTSWSQELYPYKVDSLFGYSDHLGKLIISPTWEKADFFNQKGYAIVTRDGFQMIIDKNGKVVENIKGIKLKRGQFKSIQGRSSGRFYTFQHGKYGGIIDSTLTRVWKVKNFQMQTTMDNKHFIVYQESNGEFQSGLMDNEGKMILPIAPGQIRVKYLENNSKEYLILRIHNGSEMAFDEKGQRLFDNDYNDISSYCFHRDSIVVCKGEGFFDIYDAQFEPIIIGLDTAAYRDPALYKAALEWPKMTAAIFSKAFDSIKKVRCLPSDNGQYNYCWDWSNKHNKNESNETLRFGNGNNLLREGEKYEYVNEHLGFISYSIDGKYGLRNFDNQTIFSPSENRVRMGKRLSTILIQQDSTFQFYSPQGDKLAGREYAYADAYKLKKDRAADYAFHAGDGIPLSDFIYKDITHLGTGKYVAELGNESHLLSSQGEILKILPYKSIDDLVFQDAFLVRGEKGYGAISKDGEEIIEPKYGPIAYLTDPHRSILSSGRQRKKIFNSKGVPLKLDYSKVERFNTSKKVLAEGYMSVRYKNGVTEYFNPKGKPCLTIPARSGSIQTGSGLAKLGLIKIDDYYASYVHGVIYKSDTRE